jgi:hypothetical protein
MATIRLARSLVLQAAASLAMNWLKTGGRIAEGKSLP